MSTSSGGRWQGVQWGLLPILFVPILLSLWRPDRAPDDANRPNPPAEADYYIRDAKTSVMSTDGRLQYQIRANEVVHYPDQSARLSSVRVHYQSPGLSNWLLTAAIGLVPAPIKDAPPEVQLTGGVEITGQRSEQARANGLTQLLTDHATVFPDTGRLHTDALVEMREPGVYARAIGMTVDTQNNTLALASEVRVLYESYAVP